MDMAILAFHLALVGLCFGVVAFADVNAIDFTFGFFLGVTLYSLHWRWKYGHWPD